MKKLLLILSITAIVSSCKKDPHQVKYTLSCSSCDVSYENQSGNLEDKKGVNSKWSYSFEGKPEQFVYILAQNKNDTGSVTVKIICDGATFKHETSSTPYGIVIASGGLP